MKTLLLPFCLSLPRWASNPLAAFQRLEGPRNLRKALKPTPQREPEVCRPSVLEEVFQGGVGLGPLLVWVLDKFLAMSDHCALLPCRLHLALQSQTR